MMRFKQYFTKTLEIAMTENKQNQGGQHKSGQQQPPGQKPGQGGQQGGQQKSGQQQQPGQKPGQGGQQK